jgi:hypothetical protein
MLTNHSPVDRLGLLNQLNFAYEPIPEFNPNFNKSFEDICLETAVKFWQDNNHISVLWSGGIDSTCVALALMETKPIDKTLVLIGTENSIDEYPAFYEKHKNIISIIDTLFVKEDLYRADTLFVHGDVGDQIFGGAISENLDQKDEPWETVFLKNPDPFHYGTKEKLQWTKHDMERFINKLHNHNSYAPFPIKTHFDFCWWLTFTTKINYVQHKITKLIADVHAPITDKIAINNRVPFYLNDDFQLWSMACHDLKFPGDELSYKQPAKDFITARTEDYEFMRTKSKFESTKANLESNWHTNWLQDKNTNYALTESGKVYNTVNDIEPEILSYYIDGHIDIHGHRFFNNGM